jgi:thiol-disulfide isomerase/thioredoxin
MNLIPLLGLALMAQDVPVDIPKSELPAKAMCVICKTKGETAEEKAAAGVKYKGTSYYFCNTGEVAEFKKAPDSFIPAALPYTAPQHEFLTLDGAKKPLSELHKDKWVLLDFWATWCGPCIKAFPHMDKVSKEYADKGLVVYGVSIDEQGARKVKPFWEKRKLSYGTLIDNSDDPAYGKLKIKAIPAVFLINPQGQVVREWRGGIDEKKFDAELAAALSVER